MFLTGGASGRLKLWRSDRGTPLYSTDGGPSGLLGCGVLSAIKLDAQDAQQFLLTLVEGRLVQVAVHCSEASGIAIDVEHEIVGDLGEVTDAAFLPHGGGADGAPMLAVATNSETVRVHNTASASLGVAAALAGHMEIVLCLSVDEDGGSGGKSTRPPAVFVAAGAKDGRVLLWRQWRRGGGKWQCVASAEGHVSAVAAVALNVQHRVMLTGAADRTLKSWALPDALFEDRGEAAGGGRIKVAR